jgi:ubiquinone/menaquinone biosynthesis C-methylase UbiE
MGIRHVLLRLLSGKHPVNTVDGPPEAYWITRKADIIGNATLDELRHTRQIQTYRALYEAVIARKLDNVLDLGCNISALGQLFCDWGYSGTYIGVDSNAYAIETAERVLQALNAPHRFYCANIRELPFEARQFPCVVMKDVLEHMEHFHPLLAEAARVSSRYLLVSNFIPWTEGRTIIWRQPQGFYHNLYNRHEVYTAARTLGFRVDEVISTLESDARPNEVVVFVRDDTLDPDASVTSGNGNMT